MEIHRIMKSANLLKKLNSNYHLFIQTLLILCFSFFKSKQMGLFIVMVAFIFVLNIVLLEYKCRKFKYKKIYSCYIFEDGLGIVNVNCIQTFIIEFTVTIYFILTKNLDMYTLITLSILCIFNLFYLKTRRKYEIKK